LEKGLKILEKWRGKMMLRGARQRKQQTENPEKPKINNKTLTTVKNATRRTCLESSQQQQQRRTREKATRTRKTTRQSNGKREGKLTRFRKSKFKYPLSGKQT